MDHGSDEDRNSPPAYYEVAVHDFEDKKMRPAWWIVILVFSVSSFILIVLAWQKPFISSKLTLSSTPNTMKITSSAFADSGFIPVKYTCDGQGINPPLDVSGLPAKTKSLALIMEDPDVPRNLRPDGMFIHWLVWNVPPSGTIAENKEPDGVVGYNTGGSLGYVPPCPPHGTHRYFFRLFALDAELVLPSNASKADLVHAMQHNILDQAELMGRYGRQE